MKYVIWPKDKPIIHDASGVANTKDIKHVRRNAPFTELMIMLEGTMYIKHIQEYTLEKGDIFILPQNIEHYGTKPSSFIVQWSHFILPADFQIIDKSVIYTSHTTPSSVTFYLKSNIHSLIILPKITPCNTPFHKESFMVLTNRFFHCTIIFIVLL